MEKELILEKLTYLKEVLKKLKKRYEKYQTETDAEELETLFAAMSKYTEEIVESAIKINNKLLELNNDYAPSYYETFTKLERHYKLDEEIIVKLAKTAGFRNRIAHEYDKINPEITLDSFNRILDLYQEYIKIIKEIIKYI